MTHIMRMDEMAGVSNCDAGMIIDEYEYFARKNGHNPVFATVDVVYDDGEEIYDTVIKMDTSVDEKDERIIYYCDGIDDFLSLLSKNDTPSDFIVTEFKGFSDEI